MSIKGCDISKCILWKGNVGARGYGRKSVKNKLQYAHRLAYQSKYPKRDITGLSLHHMCFNPLCINPEHLLPVTQLEHRHLHELSGFALIYKNATTCKWGHPLDGKNKKQRFCLTCKRASQKKYHISHREQYNKYRREFRKKQKEFLYAN
jgi:hypothetical protein